MNQQQPSVAVIIDLVGSRRQPDRAGAQQQLVDALAQVNSAVKAEQPLAPTIGDESQGVYADVPSALLATLLVRLVVSEPLDCRFGIGVGRSQSVGESDYGPMQDGPAWWSARDAIVEAKRREGGKHKLLRSWYSVAEGELSGSPQVPDPDLTNAYLMSRDQLVSDMNDRSRRLLLGLLKGRTQVQLAEQEHISQSAVSQNLQRSGAFAVLGGVELLGAKVAR
ncbi:MAG: hypothetical protein JWQ70_371 [Aeromicrobium sp.]|jgi:hypothetical protein|nr:hypothetical protein [Aeromicrobium sp.]